MTEKLDLDRIQRALVNDCSVTVLECVDSTNQWVLDELRDGKAVPFACFTEQQTAGRGRRGKAWVSSSNNIAMSFAWSFDVPVSELGVLSLATGVAVVQALKKIGIKQAMLKWPNDILVDDMKIAGILIETAKINDKKTSVVIGIGLNYNFEGLQPGVPDQAWIDVVSLLGAEPDGGRNQLAGLLLQQCMAMCGRMPHESNELIGEFQGRYDACAHREVCVLLESGEQLHGLACGVTPMGEIRIRIDDKERVFNSAEISLRRSDATNPDVINTLKGPVYADD